MSNAKQIKIYRISKKMVKPTFEALNSKNVLLQTMKSLLDEESLKKVAGTPYIKEIVRVYVDEEGRNKKLPSHKTISLNKGYVDFWGEKENILYGNIIIVCSDKFYNRLPDILKTTDVNEIVL